MKRLLQTPENFTSLATLLRPPSTAQLATTQTVPQHCEPDCDVLEKEAACRDVRLFRARVSEALEASIEALCSDLASDVLARELLLAPTDVRALCRQLLERYTHETPLLIRLHPSECESLSDFEMPVFADARLRPGDVMLEVKHGALNASLGVRLEHVLSKRRL